MIVEGTITAYFDAPGMARWFWQAKARQTNDLLRFARPHMPRRQWQRLRGRMKANLRAERIAWEQGNG